MIQFKPGDERPLAIETEALELPGIVLSVALGTTQFPIRLQGVGISRVHDSRRVSRVHVRSQ